MITNMTWAQYWTIILTVSVIYYSVILFTFYRRNLVAYLKRFSDTATKDLVHEQQPVKNNEENAVAFEENDYPLLTEMRETFQQASLKNFSIEEIIFSLQITISKYNAATLIKKENAINHFIQNECNQICSIYLDDERLRQLWIR